MRIHLELFQDISNLYFYIRNELNNLQNKYKNLLRNNCKQYFSQNVKEMDNKFFSRYFNNNDELLNSNSSNHLNNSNNPEKDSNSIFIKEGEMIIEEIKNKTAFDSFTFGFTRSETSGTKFEAVIKNVKHAYEEKVQEISRFLEKIKKTLEKYYRTKINFDAETDEEIKQQNNNPLQIEYKNILMDLRELYEKKLQDIENVIEMIN